MILKDLPKFQNVSGGADVVDLSSLTSEGSPGTPGETNKKSSERGGKGTKAAKALLAVAARRGAREEVMERNFKRDDDNFRVLQSNLQNMERSIGMLNQTMKRKADLMALNARLEVTEDEENRVELKRKISEI
jgi:hypothetical protein